MSYGFVYILNNQVMPHIYKIGYTDKSPLQRCDELSSKTSVPVPYEVICYCELWNAFELEQSLHKRFESNRINDNREFFRLTYKDIFDIHNIMKEESTNFTCCQELDIILDLYLKQGDKNGMV